MDDERSEYAGPLPQHRLFPLTSLQIGDLQSYYSKLYLFLTCDHRKLFILVDNSPWLSGDPRKAAQIWQLMVTMSRSSPFANSRKRPKYQHDDKQEACTNHKEKNIRKWFSVIDAATWHHKALSPVKDLQHMLHGCIVFEVSWADVRGINYLNELQTDTTVALEVKRMIKKEYADTSQALQCIESRCFDNGSQNSQSSEGPCSPVSSSDRGMFVTRLDYGHEGGNTESPRITSEHRIRTPITSDGMQNHAGLRKRKHGSMSENGSRDDDSKSTNGSAENMTGTTPQGTFDVVYKDVLIIFRFNDPLLPFELQKIITSDLRLLRLLESGLPSWVIFFQSYPLICKFYCPWMRPLARTLYILMSIVTVLIGFYDLYKNVPVLKVTAARLCGPLFEWIETWEMVSRLKYLGTMLFLQNFEKTFEWSLSTMRTVKQLASLITKPMVTPVMELGKLMLPIIEACAQMICDCFSSIAVAFSSVASFFVYIFQLLFWPFVMLCTFVQSMVQEIICPVVLVFWEVVTTPVSMVVKLADSVTLVTFEVLDFVKSTWQSLSGLSSFMSTSGEVAKTSSSILPGWRALWNEIFSKVFYASRSILNGFVAFFTACNRHRLSIYNHFMVFLQWLLNAMHLRHDHDRRKSQTKGQSKRQIDCLTKVQKEQGPKQPNSFVCTEMFSSYQALEICGDCILCRSFFQFAIIWL